MAAFEVIALDTATPQLRAPGAADTYTFPRAVEMPLGTANGVLYLNGSKVVTSGSGLTFDGTTFKATATLQLVDPGASRDLLIAASTTGAAHRFYSTNTAAGYSFENSSGSLMTLTALGNLGIGTSSPGNYKLNVNGSTYATCGFTSYTADGLFGATALPSVVNTPGTSNQIRFGYYDEGSNNYVPRIGFYQDGTYNTAASWAIGNNINGTFSIALGTTNQVTLTQAGNLGLGVTPSAWNTAYRAIDMGSGAIMATPNGSDTYYTQNAYYGTGNTWVYKFSGALAARYQQAGGVHSWHNAPSGTAGNAISFTQAMTLDASGNLGIGTTSPGVKIDARSSTNDVGLQLKSTWANTAIILDRADASSESKIVIRTLGVDGYSFGQFSGGANALEFRSGAANRFALDANGNVIVNNGAVATTATNGFLYVAGCAGTPTGTPTTYTGRVPIVVDTTNNKLYFYSGGQWRDAGP